jgi:hypothetical protein
VFKLVNIDLMQLIGFQGFVCINALCYANSAANPIVYTIFSDKFRRRLLLVLMCRREVERAPPPPSMAVATGAIARLKCDGGPVQRPFTSVYQMNDAGVRHCEFAVVQRNEQVKKSTDTQQLLRVEAVPMRRLSAFSTSPTRNGEMATDTVLSLTPHHKVPTIGDGYVDLSVKEKKILKAVEAALR